MMQLSCLKFTVMRFANKVCIVTGGGSGIGRAICVRLADEGASVIVADRDEDSAKETVELIQQKGGNSLSIRTDVSVESDIQNCISETVKKFNRIDVVVNDAAMMTFNKITELESSAWDQLMAVNLRSVFLFCKYAIPHMKDGAVVNISSVHAHQTTANVLPYAASKGAMEAFTRGLSLEYKSSVARFNCIAPGAVDTPMLWSNPNVKSGAEKIEGDIGKPEDIAAAVCFLASTEAAYINGTTLVVDGSRLAAL